MPAEDGAVVLKALEAAIDTQYAGLDEAASEDVTAVTSEGKNCLAYRRADALATMAEKKC